jgi:hypothetical protein
LFTSGPDPRHTLTHVNATDPTSAMSLGPERSDVAAPPAFAGSSSTSEEPTRQLSVAGSSDHCVNCGAPLASDQRYCVNCGERRGKPRFALAPPQEGAAEEVTTTRSASTPRRPRTSAGFNLIAGVATLLLAMGVGVLIGHNSSASDSTKSAAAPAITINGGGAANGTAGTAAAAGAAASGAGATASTGKAKHHGAAKSAKAKAPPKVVIQKAAAAASKVTGGSAKTAAPTATQGSSCASGTAGCQNGKLTGSFFGQ